MNGTSTLCYTGAMTNATSLRQKGYKNLNKTEKGNKKHWNKLRQEGAKHKQNWDKEKTKV